MNNVPHLDTTWLHPMHGASDSVIIFSGSLFNQQLHDWKGQVVKGIGFLCSPASLVDGNEYSLWKKTWASRNQFHPICCPGSLLLSSSIQVSGLHADEYVPEHRINYNKFKDRRMPTAAHIMLPTV